MNQHYDAVIIGSGQGGSPLAEALAKAGWKTALVERKHIGGTCVNEGCTPSKTMIASARVAYLAQRAANYGVHTGKVSVKMGEVRRRKEGVVNNSRERQIQRYETTENLDVVMGEAHFVDAKTLEIDLNTGEKQRLTADKIFINTGGRAAMPPIKGLDTVKALTEVSVMDIEMVPKHLMIVGGGAIGMEQGQMFRRFGSQVTIIERGSQLLPFVDPTISEAVLEILREDGIEVLLDAEVKQVKQSETGYAVMVKVAGKYEQSLLGSHLLMAAGRVPNTEVLNLAAAGVETDAKGYIKTNERLETTAPNIYALGDVKGGPAFTHISYDDFRVVRANLLEGGKKTITDRPVPYTIFIDPELAHVAIEMDESRGMMKAVIDADTDQILGFTVLGISGGEMMSVVEVAMLGKVPYTTLRDAIFAHPTLSECLNNLFAMVK